MAVFPSSDTLPENLLRMYIHFSKPMRITGNLEKIKLVDADGQELVGAIFNNVQELWDREQQQLTLILDPARVKTGLVANERLGRALQAGKPYQLVIGQLEDAEGTLLKAAFTKLFYVSKEDRRSPNTALWTTQIPKADSQSPLIVQFPEMLDHLSLEQRLQLTDQNNQPIVGQVAIVNHETEWRFLPTEKWSSGDYILYVHGRLEDPCGNNLNGLFDHKMGSLKNEREGAIERIPITIN
ncbi:MAG: hypothetical protein AAGG75_15150 [Bacteroidota bacterium]